MVLIDLRNSKPLPKPKPVVPLPTVTKKNVSRLRSVDEAPAPPDASLAEAVEIFRRFGRLYSLRFGSLPRQKTVESRTRAKMMKDVDADTKQLSISKKLLPDDERIAALSGAQSSVRIAFEKRTHPYPITGIRLFVFDTTKLDIENMKTEDIEKELAAQRESFESEIKGHVAEYFKRVDELADAWPDIIEKARRLLRETFNERDYMTPQELRERLKIDFGAEGLISVSGPETAHMSPAAQAAEQARVRQRFEDAIKMQEEFMLTAFSSAIADLLESVQKKDTGETNCFKSSRIQHVFDCFTEFKQKCLRYGILQGTALQNEIEKAQAILNYGNDKPGDVHKRLTNEASVRRDVIAQLKNVSGAVANIVEIEKARANRRAVMVD